MSEPAAERRRRAVEALAGARAIGRRRETGEDWDTAFAACLAEAEGDPMVETIIAVGDTAPPPERWDPEVARDLRRLLRGAARRKAAGS
jgi:hypothetical protein